MKEQGVGGGGEVSFPISYEKTTPMLTYYGFLFRLSPSHPATRDSPFFPTEKNKVKLLLDI